MARALRFHVERHVHAGRALQRVLDDAGTTISRGAGERLVRKHLHTFVNELRPLFVLNWNSSVFVAHFLEISRVSEDISINSSTVAAESIAVSAGSRCLENEFNSTTMLRGSRICNCRLQRVAGKTVNDSCITTYATSCRQIRYRHWVHKLVKFFNCLVLLQHSRAIILSIFSHVQTVRHVHVSALER